MTLIDKKEIIVGDSDTAKVLNSFFSNIDSNLNIAEYFNCEPHANNISDPVLKFAVRYRNHPSSKSTQQTAKTAIFLFKDIFTDIPLASFNDSVERSNFPSSLKRQILRLYLKKVTEILRITTDQSAYFQICLIYLSDVFFANFTVLCFNSGQNTSADFAKVTIHRIAC